MTAARTWRGCCVCESAQQRAQHVDSNPGPAAAGVSTTLWRRAGGGVRLGFPRGQRLHQELPARECVPFGPEPGRGRAPRRRRPSLVSSHGVGAGAGGRGCGSENTRGSRAQALTADSRPQADGDRPPGLGESGAETWRVPGSSCWVPGPEVSPGSRGTSAPLQTALGLPACGPLPPSVGPERLLVVCGCWA